MLSDIWEHTSVYYIISILFAIICLLVTYFWSVHDEKSNVNSDSSAPSPTDDEIRQDDGQVDREDLLTLRKPLRLAKKLEEDLPEEAKIEEKMYVATLFLFFLFAETLKYEFFYTELRRFNWKPFSIWCKNTANSLATSVWTTWRIRCSVCTDFNDIIKTRINTLFICAYITIKCLSLNFFFVQFSAHIAKTINCWANHSQKKNAASIAQYNTMHSWTADCADSHFADCYKKYFLHSWANLNCVWIA